jgi:hypothetical protein
MPTNPHIIPSFPSDPGATQRLTDLGRSTQNVTKQYGVLGAGVRITGGMIETGSSGARVFMRGDEYDDEGPVGLYLTNSSGDVIASFNSDGIHIMGGTIEGGTIEGGMIETASSGARIYMQGPTSPGLYMTDAGGSTVVSLTPSLGLELTCGGEEVNQLSWKGGGGAIKGYVGTYESGVTTIALWAIVSPGGTGSANVIVQASDAGSYSQITANANAGSAVILDSKNMTSFPGPVGFWGKTFADGYLYGGRPHWDQAAWDAASDHDRADSLALLLVGYGLVDIS